MKKDAIMINGGEAFSVGVAMKMLGFTRPTLMGIVKDEGIGHYKIGSRYWFTPAQVTDYQEKCRVDAK